MKARVKEDDQSVPFLYNGYYYISRYEKGGEYVIISRKKGSLDSPEEILLNCNELAEGKTFFQLGDRKVSSNNEIIAYTTDTVSRRRYNVYFKNLKTGELYEETIPNTTGGITWANDNKTVFYTKQDEETLRSYRIMKHVLGTPVSEDVLVYEEKDEEFDTYIFKLSLKSFL